MHEGATVFGYYVDDPERFGVIEFDGEGKAISIEENRSSRSQIHAVTGLFISMTTMSVNTPSRSNLRPA